MSDARREEEPRLDAVLALDRCVVERGIGPEYGVVSSAAWMLVLWFALREWLGPGAPENFTAPVGIALVAANMLAAPFFWALLAFGARWREGKLRIPLVASFALVLFVALGLWLAAGLLLPAGRRPPQAEGLALSSLLACHSLVLMASSCANMAFRSSRGLWLMLPGMILSAGLLAWPGGSWPVPVQLLAASAGHVLVLILFGAAFHRNDGAIDSGLDALAFLLRRVSYPLIGLCLALTFWFDLLLHWHFAPREGAREHIATLSAGSVAIPLALLTLLPGAWVAQRYLERRLVPAVKNLVLAIEEGDQMELVRERREQIWRGLRRGMAEVAVVQMMCGGAFIALAGLRTGEIRGLPFDGVLFSVMVLGLSLVACFLFALRMLMVFGERRVGLTVSLILLLCNLVFSSAAMFLGANLLGAGLALAALCALLPAWLQVKRTVEDLDYRVFQSLAG